LFTLAVSQVIIAVLAISGSLHVLFLVADDLNCDLGCYGHPVVKTPHIDALAARGVRFEHAYCQFPLCSPSRSSFLTGRRPNATQVLTNPGRRNPGGEYGGSPHFREAIPATVTMPQLFKNNGYFVARIGKLYHYGVPGQIGTAGLDDPPSWELTVNPAGRDRAEEHRVFSLVSGTYGGTLSFLATDGTDEEHTDGLSASSAISFLEEFAKQPATEPAARRPFFLAVGFYRPHTPYVSPRHWFSQYPPAANQLPELSQTTIADSDCGLPEREEGSRGDDRRTAPLGDAGVLCVDQPHGRAGRPRAGSARSARVRGQHGGRDDERPRLSHVRTWPVAEDEPVRELGASPADHRFARSEW
jgi:arylsulfatase A-like enzyme